VSWPPNSASLSLDQRHDRLGQSVADRRCGAVKATARVMEQPLRKAALFGFPLGHSVSPAMHHAAAEALGISLSYEPWPLPEDELADALRVIRGEPWVGANVTLPHKPAVARMMDQLTANAQRIGAVNTVYKCDGALWGENTDAPALARSLTEFVGGSVAAERVLVLGAGGAARAVVVALIDLGAGEITLVNRTEERAAELVSDLETRGAIGMGRIRILPWGAVSDLMASTTLLINATSAGLDGAALPVADLPRSTGALVYDLVYGLDQTPLVRQARQAGLRASDGLWMLVYQAALAFELWTGVQPPEDVMHEAARSALRAGSKGR
jgi:shikimate dehydrogenase